MSNVIIVHGAYGHPNENWFDWLKKELESLQIVCHVPALPTPAGQTLETWFSTFSQTCGAFINENTVLIGHSLGAVFTLRWLERYQKPLKAVMLAGLFLGKVRVEKFDVINQSFFVTPFNWHAIKNCSKNFISYYGDNDPYVSKSDFEESAAHLNAKKIIVSQGGHLNAAAGFLQFPLLLTHLQSILRIGYA